MIKLNIEERKQEIYTMLAELEKDCRTLLDRIDICRENLPNVKNEQDALAFDEKFINLEDGLQHIELF